MSCEPLRYWENLATNIEFHCGTFLLTADEIVAFAERFDPQPFHLDQTLAEKSYFGTLVASGVHTQAVAIGLLVRATADVAVVAGGSLHEARFMVPVLPDTTYDVTARWTNTRLSARSPDRGIASVSGEARDPEGRTVMSFGVTYIVARLPTHTSAT